MWSVFLKRDGRVWWYWHMTMLCWGKEKFRQWSLLIRDQQGVHNETIYSCFEIWLWQFFSCWRQTITDVCLWTSGSFLIQFSKFSKAVHIYLIADVICPTHLAVYNIIVLTGHCGGLFGGGKKKLNCQVTFWYINSSSIQCYATQNCIECEWY